MIKDTVKLQSNLDILKKEMKALLAVKDDVKNETELAEREGRVVRQSGLTRLKSFCLESNRFIKQQGFLENCLQLSKL
jgi:hypothetical protein